MLDQRVAPLPPEAAPLPAGSEKDDGDTAQREGRFDREAGDRWTAD
jgi:hypothetical protein